MILCFLLGIGAGVGGHWYLQQPSAKEHLRQATSQVTTDAQHVATTLRNTWNAGVDDIKDEMARSGMVVRDKARAAGDSIAGAAGNARVTAAIKARLVAEPGLSSFSINVDTTDGLVTLSGKVSSHDQVARAVQLALETDGVRRVISTLQVTSTGK